MVILQGIELMINLILNNTTINSDLPHGMPLLDFVRRQQRLMGTKIGCREGDCGACTVLMGELSKGTIKYQTVTSCLVPFANSITLQISHRQDNQRIIF